MQEDREDAVAIDVFDDQHLNIDRSGKGDRAIFQSNILTFLGTGEKISIVQADSLSITVDVFTKLTNRKFRIFSIDGGHTISHVINDLNLAESTLDDYGMVVVDDFFDPGWPGVSEGMFRYWARGGRLRPFAYGDGKLFLSHRDAREDYYDIATTTLYPISLKGKKVELRGDVCLHLLMPPPSVAITADGKLLSSFWDFSSGGTGKTLLGRGWSAPDRHGAWTTGRRANLRIPLQTGHRPGGISTLVRISGYPFIPPEHGRQGLLVKLDGHDLVRNEWTRNGLATVEVDVPDSLVLEGGNKLELVPDFAAAPSDSGMSADTRLLGFHLTRIVTFGASQVSSQDQGLAP